MADLLLHSRIHGTCQSRSSREWLMSGVECIVFIYVECVVLSRCMKCVVESLLSMARVACRAVDQTSTCTCTTIFNISKQRRRLEDKDVKTAGCL